MVVENRFELGGEEGKPKSGGSVVAMSREGKLSAICSELFSLVPGIVDAQEAAYEWIAAQMRDKGGEDDAILVLAGVIAKASDLLASLRKSEIAAEKKAQRDLFKDG